MKTILTIASKNENYTADVYDNEDGSFQFVGDMDIDIDGSPDWERDPYGQPDTSLHYPRRPGGIAINGQIIPFIVLPPEIIKAVKGIVLGCKASVSYDGRITDAVVADVGPHNKLGEGSPKLARNLGINDDPNHGGVDSQKVTYRFWPGAAANLGGIEFELQPYV